MTRPMHIDFAHPRRPPARGWAWLLAGLLAMGGGIAWVQQGTRQLQRQAAQADNAQRQQSYQARAGAVSAPTYASDKRWHAAARAMALPWNDTLAAVERATQPPVHLLGFSPDSERRTLRLEVEVGQYSDALDYLGRLEQDGAFGRPMLQSHETVQDPTGRPYLRAVVTVPWGQ